MIHEITTTDGGPLHVEEDGSGPPLLLVNGAFCTVRQWDLALKDLATRFRGIRHDVRGTGRSGPGPASAYRFEQYADDILTICDALGIETAALWGMAWGARVALVTAALHPDRFDRLVLSDLAIDPADVEGQKQGARAAKEARAEHGIAETPPPDGFRDHADFDQARKAMAATAAHPDLMPFVEKVTMPTLIATGEHDPNLNSSRRALPGFADARLEVLPHTGHGSVLQRPDLATRIAADFLAP